MFNVLVMQNNSEIRTSVDAFQCDKRLVECCVCLEEKSIDDCAMQEIYGEQRFICPECHDFKSGMLHCRKCWGFDDKCYIPDCSDDERGPYCEKCFEDVLIARNLDVYEIKHRCYTCKKPGANKYVKHRFELVGPFCEECYNGALLNMTDILFTNNCI